MGRPLGRDERAQRQARRVGAIGFVVAALLPVVLWHRVMADIASEFRFDLRYFVSECSPWVLILLGLAEAGFFPGILLYLSHWVPREYRARASAWFFLSQAVALAIGSGGILRQGLVHLG